MEIEVNSALITKDDWREPIMTYFQYPTLPSEKRIRIMATNYLMWNEDLVRKSKDEVLLRCLGKTEYMKVMGETHEGICGAHQGGRKMCWLIRRYGYFWPTMLKDCINYSKGCEACQRHGPIQQAPSVPMNPVVKPWPFRGWAMDLIGKIYPASSQQHCFIIVATDYFTKWVEAKPIKTTTSQEIITFIEEQIIQRFGIPESITTDRGSSFISRDMLDMAEAFKFKLLQSTPYYAQANGQAESSNKVIINIIRKMLEKNPKQWHEKLSETLWAYRTSKREATGMTPYALTYGHDAILPMEIAVQFFRIAHQHGLTGEDYSQAMLLELEELDASSYYGKLTTVVQLLYKDRYQVIMFKCRWFDTNPNRQGSVKIDHGLLSVNINITWYDDNPYILANMAKQIVYLDDPKAGNGWKVVQQMDQRNVYAIPELDPTDSNVDNVADQRLESSMENDAETLRDTNVIQEPFQLQGVSSIEIPIQSITIDLGDLPRYDVPVGPNNASDEEEDWETESDDSDDNKGYYSSDDE
ncbi:hypothetical protein L3X38_027617 [Prunus dulcis]|uniref:Integrase catalytic domain-containing protein n=1 Tax=Prunus dulcis TaxID=3755 RepID=A0AAD4VN89_PRUDU|nr:hypothetical protein L3X38_027617 [Prunus dulcis]